MKQKFILLLIFLVAFITSNAQIDFGNLEEEQVYKKENKYNVWSVTVGFGPVVYYTDVVDYTFLPNTWDEWKFGPSINVARQLGRTFAIDLNYLMANMYGKKYNRYFDGDFMEGTVNATMYINQLFYLGPMKDKWNFYLKVGFGATFFRSQMKQQQTGIIHQVDDIFTGASGYPHNYADWRADDYLVMGYSRTEPNKKENRQVEIVVPIGVGVRYRLNKSFDLGFETTLRNMRADNLDIDMTGADNDSYMYTAITLTYKIGKKDKRHSSWTYKDFNIDYSKERLRDPLAQRLDSLANVLDLIAANDSIVNDTTVIVTSSHIRKEAFSTSVFFDFDKSTITSASHRSITNIARYMNDNPNVQVLIQGYCDDRGSYEYNEKLSQRRCDAVKDILVKDYKIDPARLKTDPRGKRELLSDTRSLAPRGVHLVNRRVDVIPLTD